MNHKFIKVDNQFRITIPREMQDLIKDFQIVSIKQEGEKIIIEKPTRYIKEVIN